MSEKCRYQEVANTILAQMGGTRRLSAMIGIYHVLYAKPEDNGSEIAKGPCVTFKFKGNRKMNFCRITLDEGMDEYVMEISKIYKNDLLPRFDSEMLQWDDLVSTFERATGLYLSL